MSDRRSFLVAAFGGVLGVLDLRHAPPSLDRRLEDAKERREYQKRWDEFERKYEEWEIARTRSFRQVEYHPNRRLKADEWFRDRR